MRKPLIGAAKVLLDEATALDWDDALGDGAIEELIRNVIAEDRRQASSDILEALDKLDRDCDDTELFRRIRAIVRAVSK